jgi:hypothetical protein
MTKSMYTACCWLQESWANWYEHFRSKPVFRWLAYKPVNLRITGKYNMGGSSANAFISTVKRLGK